MLQEYENVDTKGEKMLDVGNTVVEASTVPRGNADGACVRSKSAMKVW